MKTIHKFLISSALVIIPWSSYAQSLTSKGTVELGGEFSFASQTYTRSGSSSGGSALNTLMFNPYIGVMVTEGFELGFMPGITTISQGGESATELNLFFTPAYNVNSGKAFPYFEFLIGYNSISGSGYYGSTQTYSGLGVGFGGGVKVAVGGSGLFLFNIKYLHQSYDIPASNSSNFYGSTSSSNTLSLNTVFAGVGFRIFFAPKTVRSK